jgi:hypothetical protein
VEKEMRVDYSRKFDWVPRASVLLSWSLVERVRASLRRVLSSIGSRLAADRHRLAADRHGAVSTEYVIVVGTVGLLVVSAFLVIGPELVTEYNHARNLLAIPFP